MTLCSSVVFFAASDHVMADGILYCFNPDLSIYFKVQSRSPVTFKMKVYVLTVNNSFQPLAPSFMLHGGELNNVTWSTKILKGIKCHLPPLLLLSAPLGKYEKLTLQDALKIDFRRFFTLSILHLLLYQMD